MRILADWKRGVPAAADRRLRRDCRRDVSGAQGRHGAVRTRPSLAAGTKAFGRRAEGRQHFVHSKVMAWVAFDRAANEMKAEGLNHSARRWREIADEIHAEICER